MTERERIEYIETLVWIQGDKREAYEKMSDEKLKRTHDREVERHAN